MFAYESDSFVSLLYLGTCLSVFTLLFIVEKRGWRVNRQDEKSHLSAMINKLELTGVLDRWPTLFIRVSIPIYFLLIGVSANSVPKEFESALWVIMVMLITGFAFRHVDNVVYLVRVAVYGASAFLVYVIQNHAAQMIADYRVINTIYFSVLSLAIALVARFSREAKFAPTTMDFLMVVLVIAASIFSPDLIAENSFRGAVVELVVLFYGCELVISRGNKHWSGMLSGSAMAALGIIGLKLAFFY